MTLTTTLLIVLLVAATAACIALVWVSREAVMTLRQIRALSHDTRERLVPLLEKADITVDAANVELLRLDAVITRFEDAGARVTAASATISEVVQTPAEVMTGVADKVRRAWRDRRAHAEAAKAHAEQKTEVTPDTEHAPEDS